MTQPPTDLARSILRQTPSFRALPEPVLDELVRASHVSIVDRGHVLFTEGDPAHDAFVVRSGRVHLEHLHRSGNVTAVCVIGAGDWFCCLPLLDGGAYPATAVAARRTQLCCIPTRLLSASLWRTPLFARSVLSHVGQCFRRVGCQTCHGDAGARIAWKILALSEQFGRHLPLTRREIGELAGTSVETAIRTMKSFERNGWVRLTRGHVRLVDLDALRLRCEEGRVIPR